MTRARFLSLARSKLRLCSANHRPGYWSNLPCDWPSTAWAHSEQETENGPSKPAAGSPMEYWRREIHFGVTYVRLTIMIIILHWNCFKEDCQLFGTKMNKHVMFVEFCLQLSQKEIICLWHFGDYMVLVLPTKCVHRLGSEVMSISGSGWFEI